MDKLTIEFDANSMPPPFCYKYTLELNLKGDKAGVEFAIDYYDRQHITKDEILAEGFSLEDDFHWQGELPDIWLYEIKLHIQKLIPQDSVDATLNIYIPQKNGSGNQYFRHEDSDGFAYFLQELIQAIYEITGRQDELRIYGKEVSEQSKDYCITVSFANRNVEIKVNGQKNTLPWKKSRPLMEKLFGLDYDPFNAHEKPPKKNGFFVDPGEGRWYEANKTVHDIEPDADTKKTLRKIFNGNV